MVFLPGEKVDRWVNLSYPNSPSTGVIAVEKGNPPKTYFADFVRERGSFHLSTNGNNDCMKCHDSGPRHIVPHKEYFNGAYAPAKEEINKVISSYGNTDIPFYDREKRGGPRFGQLNPKSRTLAFLRACAPNVEPKKMGTLMNCANCHDGKKRGPLTAWTGTMDYMYKHKDMPPGSHLTSEENAALVSCLSKERELLWETWPYEISCLPELDAVEKAQKVNNLNTSPAPEGKISDRADSKKNSPHSPRRETRSHSHGAN